VGKMDDLSEKLRQMELQKMEIRTYANQLNYYGNNVFILVIDGKI
jgi:hypothetical protein